MKTQSQWNGISKRTMTLFMCGDVMTGRGIDQVLPQPCDPQLHEPYVHDARRYVELAERVNGPIQRPVPFRYIWGESLDILSFMNPDLRIVNLETSITTSDEYWRGKGINYRMHPANVPVFSAAGIDICSLANNHVIDWGYAGLSETIEVLQNAGISVAGAGPDLAAAAAPAIKEIPGKGRILHFSFGLASSGIPAAWGAGTCRPGIHLLPDTSPRTVSMITEKIAAFREASDVVVASIHWGGNWGYEIEPAQRAFAHQLIDAAGVSIIHGHSSHHPLGIEVYHDHPIIYGCGDFINDYEGIGGYQQYRCDLSLMYFVAIDTGSGRLEALVMQPCRTRRFHIHRADHSEAKWLAAMLNREGKRFGTRVEMVDGDKLMLRWG